MLPKPSMTDAPVERRGPLADLKLADLAKRAYVEQVEREAFVKRERDRATETNAVAYSKQRAVVAMLSLMFGRDPDVYDVETDHAWLDGLAFTVERHPERRAVGLDCWQLLVALQCEGCGEVLHMQVKGLAQLGELLLNGRAHFDIGCIERAKAKGKLQ